MEKFQLITKINEKSMHFTYRVNSVFKNQVTFRHCTESQVTYNRKHCALPVLHCVIVAMEKMAVTITFGPVLISGRCISYMLADDS